MVARPRVFAAGRVYLDRDRSAVPRKERHALARYRVPGGVKVLDFEAVLVRRLTGVAHLSYDLHRLASCLDLHLRWRQVHYNWFGFLYVHELSSLTLERWNVGRLERSNAHGQVDKQHYSTDWAK